MKGDKEKKLEDLVMNRIKSGQVKLKSKYIFFAERLGLGTALSFSFVLAALFFNLLLFYLKETDNMRYLSFGKEGVFAFLESFPYPIVIIFIVSLLLVSYLIKKNDIFYKSSFSHIIIFLIISITFFGAVLTYTNVAERIEIESFHNTYHGRFLRPLMAPPEIRDKGMAGVVYENGEGYLIVKTPRGLMDINTEKIEPSLLREIKQGEFIVSIGERNGKEFVAQDIRVVKKEEMPGVGRGISNRFANVERPEEGCDKRIPPDIMYFEEEDKKCIQDCSRSGAKCLRDCFKECMKKDHQR